MMRTALIRTTTLALGIALTVSAPAAAWAKHADRSAERSLPGSFGLALEGGATLHIPGELAGAVRVVEATPEGGDRALASAPGETPIGVAFKLVASQKVSGLRLRIPVSGRRIFLEVSSSEAGAVTLVWPADRIEGDVAVFDLAPGALTVYRVVAAS